MGSLPSRQLALSLSREEVATFVTSLGGNCGCFKPYARSFAENGVDGELLASLSTAEFIDAMDELNITHQGHRRVLCDAFEEVYVDFGSIDHSKLMDATRSTARLSCSDTICRSCAVRRVPDSDEASSIAKTLREESELLAMENQSLCQRISELEEQQETDGNYYRAPPTAGIVTIVSTDIQGSTALWEADERAMLQALRLHDQIMRKTMAEHYGYECETEGDAFIMAFHEPSHAIAFGLALQQNLHRASWSDKILRLTASSLSTNDGRRGLRVRICIHQGQVTTFANPVSGRLQYAGPAMKITKKLEGQAQGGQILTTLQTWRDATTHSAELHQRARVSLVDPSLMFPMDQGICSVQVVSADGL
ncbi:Adenylate cyclase [Seminavis robusta]|uniref:Adenylate cyclase n=1 Tax=Seminavis robusta TaxID=568900 RepID=A0A9N8EIR9_9STRA|nr:Adenylate cyclase [Seminavis robusta]|eukprot:Sro1145_g246230.1 Adenylate cyclase (365) ;mRNA; r:21378-22472